MFFSGDHFDCIDEARISATEVVSTTVPSSAIRSLSFWMDSISIWKQIPRKRNRWSAKRFRVLSFRPKETIHKNKREETNRSYSSPSNQIRRIQGPLPFENQIGQIIDTQIGSRSDFQSVFWISSREYGSPLGGWKDQPNWRVFEHFLDAPMVCHFHLPHPTSRSTWLKSIPFHPTGWPTLVISFSV